EPAGDAEPLEAQVDLSTEVALYASFDKTRAKASAGRRFHRWPTALVPNELQQRTVSAFEHLPNERELSLVRRQCAVLRGIGGQFIQRHGETERSPRGQRNGRPL